MPAFTDSQLEAFAINPRRPALWGKCPFCPGSLIVGHRKDTDNVCLAHSALPDPTAPGHLTAGCERFEALVQQQQPELMRLLQAAGLRLRPVQG